MSTTGAKRAAPARKASPRKAAPRKRAATQDDGEAIGEADATAAVASPSPEGKDVEKAPPPPPDKAMLNGYERGTPLYVWEGPDGEIVLPHISTVRPDPVFFYDIYDLPEMFQTFEWFKKAGVPHSTGRKAMALTLAMRRELMGGWFQGMKEAAPDQKLQGGLPGE